MESTQWLEPFHPFSAVQDLYVSKKLGSLVALGLQELTGEGAAEVLPGLRNLSFGGLKPYTSVREVIGPLFLRASTPVTPYLLHVGNKTHTGTRRTTPRKHSPRSA